MRLDEPPATVVPVLDDVPVRRAVSAARVLAVGLGDARHRSDRLATEEPMEIRVQVPGGEPQPVAITMRTPGHDFELAAGWCHHEGVVRGLDDLATIRYCLGRDGAQQYNVVTVAVRTPAAAVRPRSLVTSSSCGLCGKAALADLDPACAPVDHGLRVDASVVRGLPEQLGAHQRVFGETGGLHAAARFDAGGALVAVREDVGRHNALDKLVGHALLARALPATGQVLLVSGRLSFELVQKAAAAGFPVVCAVSAPSSLAVAAAERAGLTVVGFLRDGRFNVYTHPDRIVVGS